VQPNEQLQSLGFLVVIRMLPRNGRASAVDPPCYQCFLDEINLFFDPLRNVADHRITLEGTVGIMKVVVLVARSAEFIIALKPNVMSLTNSTTFRVCAENNGVSEFVYALIRQ
jgi:hypothetical protein